MFCLSVSQEQYILTILSNSRRKKKRKEKKLTIFQNQNCIIHKIDKDGQIIQKSTITILQIKFTALIYR